MSPPMILLEQYRKLETELIQMRQIHAGGEFDEEETLVETMAEIWLDLSANDQEILRAEGPKTILEDEIRLLADALLGFFDGLDRVSQKSHLVQPGIALTKKHRLALEIAERFRTPEPQIPTLKVCHIGSTGDNCNRCGVVIPTSGSQFCLTKVCGERSPDPIHIDDARAYVQCSNTDCDGTNHEALLESGVVSITWKTWPDRLPWFTNMGKCGPACDDTERYRCTACGESEYTRHDPSDSCPSCGLACIFSPSSVGAASSRVEEKKRVPEDNEGDDG